MQRAEQPAAAVKRCGRARVRRREQARVLLRQPDGECDAAATRDDRPRGTARDGGCKLLARLCDLRRGRSSMACVATPRQQRGKPNCQRRDAAGKPG
jgi:hypothetical protein